MADNKARVTKLITHLTVTDEGAYATKAGAYAEMLGSGLRVTSAGALAEILYSPPEVAAMAVHTTSGQKRFHYRLPPEVTGYALDPSWSMWTIIVPEATLNYFTNPSFEESTSFGMIYSGAGMVRALTRTAAAGCIAGEYALALTPTTPVTDTAEQITQETSLAAGHYTFSIWMYASGGDEFLMEVVSGAGPTLIHGNNVFTVDYTGWHRYHITVTTTATAQLRGRISFPTLPAGGTVWTDAWQLENKAYPTTYADGNMIGYFSQRSTAPYYWLGTPHESESVRTVDTRSGGIEYSLSDDVHFLTTSIVGLGMNPVDVKYKRISTGQDVFDSNVEGSRKFTITGRLYGKTLEELSYKRDRLIGYLQPESNKNREPLVIRYNLSDNKGACLLPPVEIICSYIGGLEGNLTNYYTEGIALQFQASRGIRSVVRHASSTGRASFTIGTGGWIDPGNYITGGTEVDGAWGPIGTANWNSAPQDMSWQSELLNLLTVGQFSSIYGQTTVNGAIIYNVSAGTFYKPVDDDPAGAFDANPYRCAYGLGEEKTNIVVYGNMTVMGAVTMRKIAHWDSSTSPEWTELATGLSGGAGLVLGAVVPVPNGDYYICGDFTQDATTTATKYGGIVRYDLSADAFVGLQVSGSASGLDSYVYDAVIGTDGWVYIVGDFAANQAATVSTLNGAVRYDPTNNVFYAMGDGMALGNNKGYVIAQGKDGFIYAVTRTGSNNDTIVRWNGSSWSEVITFATGTYISDMAFDRDGSLHIVGSFYPGGTATKLATQDNYLILNQNVLFNGPLEVSNPAGTDVPAIIKIDHLGRKAVGYTGLASDGVDYPEETSLSVISTTNAYPVIRVTGPGRIREIQNQTTGAYLSFRDDFYLGNGETLYIDFENESPQIYSDIRSGLEKFLLSGTSNLSEWFLRPGVNKIRVLGLDVVEDIMAMSISYRETYTSIDPVS